VHGKVLVGLENLHKAYDLKDYTVSVRNDILFYLENLYMSVGYFDRSEKYRIELLQFNKQDSMYYYDYYSLREATLGNIDKAISWEEKALALSPGSLIFELTLGELHSFKKQYERSYLHFQKWEKPLKNWRTPIIINSWIWVGYTYWLMGNQKEAEFWFNRVVDRNLRHIVLKNGKEDNYDLARVYALQGDLEKTYYYLDKYNTGNFKGYGEIITIKNDPFFENIRGEERFQTIVRSMENKYQKERERVRIWLEEKNML
jgi:tetratricopeptide (TPR) repeat protein